MLATRRTALVSLAMAVALAVALLYPVVSIFREAFSVDGHPSLANVRELMETPGLRVMTRNTVLLTIGGAIFSTLLGVLIAVATTVLPSRPAAKALLQLAPVVPLTIPPLVGAVGWLFLLSPRAGWINIFLRWVTNDDSGVGPLTAFSLPVVIWVMGLYVVPYVYTIMATSLSRLNAELLESYQVCGATPVGAMVRAVVGPLRPAFLASVSLAVVHSLSQFAVPLILEWNVLTTYLYRQVTFLGNYPRAAVVALPLFAVALTFTFLQIRLTRRHNRYATVSGRGGGVRAISFGPVRDRLLRAVVYVYLLAAGVLPMGAIIVVSLISFWRPAISFQDLSISNYVGVWENSLVRAGAANSVRLAVACAILATVMALVVTILVERVGDVPSRSAYLFANLPLGLPLVLLGFAFLIAFISPPIVLYGTIWILLLAYLVSFLPIAIRNMGPVFQQIGVELEEAAVVSGASWGRAWRKVTLPLIMPGFTASVSLLFLLIFREFPLAAFLSTPQTNVISMSLLSYNEVGRWPYVAVISLGLSAVSVLVIVLSNVVAKRFEIIARVKHDAVTSAPAAVNS